MHEERRKLLTLIILRLVLSTLFLGVASPFIPQPHITELLRPFLLTVYVLSALYVVLWKYGKNLSLAYSAQFYSDLVLITLLIYLSGGVHSPFTPFYVLIIVYASLLRQSEGGILALTLSVVSYIGIVHLGYLGLLPDPLGSEAYENVIYRLGLNIPAFVAVALLGIQLSERLQKADRELRTTRGSLEELTALHENVVNSIRSGLVTLDLAGHITSFNRAAREIWAFRQEEILRKPLSAILPQAILTRILEADFEANPRALRQECWIENKQGRSLFLGMSCSPLLSKSNEKIGYVLSAQDLTEIKELEEEIQLREKLATIGQLAAGLAHEIRNPLGSISGSIQILRSELNLSEDKARLIEIALRESERLNKIVEDFLAYAKPQVPTHYQPVDLSGLVQETVALCKNDPDYKDNHSIEIVCPSQVIHCWGNPDQLRQVVWNVMQNGLRAMPHGGRLLIELRGEDSQTLIRFKDEGVGMTPEERKKLFQPFQGSFKQGAGLGMAIVYQIIQQHRGRISIRSRLRQGTIVEITVPARGSQVA